MVSRVRKAERMAQGSGDDPLDDIPFFENDDEPKDDGSDWAKRHARFTRMMAEKRRKLAEKVAANQRLFDKPVGTVVDSGGLLRCLVTKGSPPDPNKDNADKVKLVKDLIRTKQLNGFLDVDHVHEWADYVHANSPWMAPLSEYLMNELVMRIKHGVRCVGFSPVIVHGDPGIGKTHYARMVAESAGVPFLVMDGATMNSSFQISGVEKGWSSAAVSPIVKLIADTDVANPVVVIDEIDKIGGLEQRAGNPHHALLGLLETASAKAWRCPYTELTIDLSRVSWMLTANDITKVSQPLLDRCKVIRANSPTAQDVRRFVEHGLDGHDPQIIEEVIKATAGRSLRLAGRMIQAVADAGRKRMLH